MQATTRRLTIAAGAVAAANLLAACGGGSSPSASVPTASSAAAFPVTIHTTSGPVVISSRPTAIVSLSPSATEDLFAIGAGSQVKAVDKYSDYPPSAPTTNISEINTNVESVAALKPDLVVLADAGDSLGSRLKALSIPVLVLPAAKQIADVYTEMNELGQATGHVQQAMTVAGSVRTQVQQIVSSLPKQTKPLTYYYELSPDYYSLTSDTFVGQLLKLLGMRSIADTASDAAKSGGYPQLSSEFIVKANPDFVFLADTICCQQTALKVTQRAGWTQMAAVRMHHVVPLSDDIASRWGPRIVVLLRTIADAVRAHG
jgi:iron complex transport system substrate-binding protein